MGYSEIYVLRCVIVNTNGWNGIIGKEKLHNNPKQRRRRNNAEKMYFNDERMLAYIEEVE